MTVTSGLHIQKDKGRQQRRESDIRWGLKDPESGVIKVCHKVKRLKHVGARLGTADF